MRPHKKLTFKQALLVLGNGEKIRSAPNNEGDFMTIAIDEKNQFILNNTGYMEMHDFSNEQWYVELDVFENIFW